MSRVGRRCTDAGRERWVPILENSNATVSMGRRVISPPRRMQKFDDEFFLFWFYFLALVLCSCSLAPTVVFDPGACHGTFFVLLVSAWISESFHVDLLG